MALRKKLLPLLLITSYWAAPVWAEEPDFFPDSEKKNVRNWRPLLAIGYMKGRETYYEKDIVIYQGTKDNIVDRKHSEIEMASGPEIKVGLHWDINDKLAIRATAGASGDSMSYEDPRYQIQSGKDKGKDLKVTLTLVRYPVEAIAFYKMGNHYFGAGINKHLGIKFDATSYPDGGTFSGDADPGLVLEYDYVLKESFYAAFRFSSSTYSIKKPDENSKSNYDASAVGLNFGYMF